MSTLNPPHPGAPAFATKVHLDSRPDALILTFELNERDGSSTPVGRIAFAPGSLESLYLEIGGVLEDRKERGWDRVRSA